MIVRKSIAEPVTWPSTRLETADAELDAQHHEIRGRRLSESRPPGLLTRTVNVVPMRQQQRRRGRVVTSSLYNRRRGAERVGLPIARKWEARHRRARGRSRVFHSQRTDPPQRSA